jgi:hypothetical protein
MRTQLLSGAGKRVLGTVLACSVWAAMPAGAKAQAVAYTDKTITVSVSSTGGMMVVWKTKGSLTVSNLPANRNIYINLKFERKTVGGGWTKFRDVHLSSSTGAGGSRTLETDYEIFTPAPAQGEKFRFVATGTYDDANTPPNPIAIPGPGDSNESTPTP